MAKNTKIICTVVPKGLDKTIATFSVFLSPRLPESGWLKDYYEISRWNKFVHYFRDEKKFNVLVGKCIYDNATNYTISSEPPVRLPALFDSSIIDSLKQHNDDLGTADLLWNCLFKENTPVKGWELDEGEYKPRTVFLNRDLFHGAEGEPPIDQIPVILKHMTEDVRENVMSVDEISFRNKENQEFHKKVSILADYPHLLRATGWILDFTIDLNNAESKNNLFGGQLIKLDFSELKYEGSEWGSLLDEIDFKCPWTYYRAGDSFFEYKYCEALCAYYEIQDRYITTSTEYYDIQATQYDRISNFEKFSENLKSKPDALTSSDFAVLKGITSPSGDAVDAVRTSEGIVLKVAPKGANFPAEIAANNQPGQAQNIKIHIGNIDVNGKPRVAVNIEDYIIFGHNLDCGYVIEVTEFKKNNFNSLCLRTADYCVDRSTEIGKQKHEVLLEKYSDEGWISEVAVAGKSGTVYVNEEICRWNNWSLICPQPGDYVQDEEIHRAPGEKEFNDLELTNVQPLKKSLTPLRFGKKYEFRVRVIDICGTGVRIPLPNNKGFIPLSDGDGKLKVHMAEPYRRMEPVGKIELFFTEKAYHRLSRRQRREFNKEHVLRTIPRYQGERENVMVIRTNGGQALNIIPMKPEESLRTLCPQRVNVHFAEQHGLVDNDLLSIYNKASYEKGETDQEHFEPSEEVPFVTDPVVQRVQLSLRILSTMNLSPSDTGLNYPDWKPEYFPFPMDNGVPSSLLMMDPSYMSLKFKTVQLEFTSKTNSLKINKDKDVAYVNLMPGTIGHLYVTVKSEDVRKECSTDFFYSTPDKIVNPFKSFKKITVVHAVKKPVLFKDKGIDDPIRLAVCDRLPLKQFRHTGIKSRYLGNTNIDILFQLPTDIATDFFPFATSSEIILEMTWTEFTPDKNNPKGYTSKKIIKSKSISNLCAKSEGQFRDNPETAVDDVLMPLKFSGESISAFIDDHRFDQDCWLSHSFGDTRYRKVNYTIYAVSRFKQFFQEESPELFSINKKIAADKHGKDYDHHIKNSVKPKAPVIHSIVPLFQWNENKNSVVKTNTTFRIYLEGDWYESGEGEKIAVVYQLDMPTVADELSELVTSFGSDPEHEGNRTTGFNLFKGVSEGTVDSALLNFVLTNESDNIAKPPGTDLQYNTFFVSYDMTKKLFYSDIELDEKKYPIDVYMPFLRFAISRFQEHSIVKENFYDYRFSQVTMASAVQIMPTRAVQWEIKSNSFHLDVRGFLPDKKTKNNKFFLRIYQPLNENVTTLDNPEVIRQSSPAARTLFYVPLDKDELKYTPDLGLHIVTSTETKNIMEVLSTRAVDLEEYEIFEALDGKGKEIKIRTRREIGNISFSDPSNDLTHRLVFHCNLLNPYKNKHDSQSQLSTLTNYD